MSFPIASDAAVFAIVKQAPSFNMAGDESSFFSSGISGYGNQPLRRQKLLFHVDHQVCSARDNLGLYAVLRHYLTGFGQGCRLMEIKFG